MEPLSDSYGRNFSYLRLSITEVCNFKCVYCLPNGYKKPAHSSSELSVDEIRCLVAAFSEMGFRKVRLTGGEPMVRRDLYDIARCISEIDGIEKLALTTNGFRLVKGARKLKESGVNYLNVSVDSLMREQFREITGKDKLLDVLKGIEAALDLGFESIKINAVLLRDRNIDAVNRLIEWTRQAPLSVRFIELMETGDNDGFFQKHHLSADWLRTTLQERGWKPKVRGHCAGPAQEFTHPDYSGAVGLIAPYSKDFCTTCNRLRVNSQGGLQLCLFGQGHYSLRHLLQSDEQKEELQETIRDLISDKTQSHVLHQGISGGTSSLSVIGG